MYDRMWRITSVEVRENGEQTRYFVYKYNDEGKIMESVQVRDGFSSTETWTYYPDGTLKENVFDAGEVITRQYTPTGKPARISFQYSGQLPRLVYEYTYNKQGLPLRSQTTENGVITETISYQYTYY
jgi:antitoxin component YwqK of YwqJK toxin-antitoxin module